SRRPPDCASTFVLFELLARSPLIATIGASRSAAASQTGSIGRSSFFYDRTIRNIPARVD
ncbi:MAG: hypothetical protein ABIZ71_01095, partial [Gemmatimonadales bacterium]